MSAGQLKQRVIEALHHTMERFDGEPLTYQVMATAPAAEPVDDPLRNDTIKAANPMARATGVVPTAVH